MVEPKKHGADRFCAAVRDSVQKCAVVCRSVRQCAAVCRIVRQCAEVCGTAARGRSIRCTAVLELGIEAALYQQQSCKSSLSDMTCGGTFLEKCSF